MGVVARFGRSHMTILKRIAPASAFKVGFVVYGLLGLFLGALCTAVAFAGVQFAPHAHMPLAGRVGMFAVIICPIVYGLLGAIGAAIGAVIYNLASGWVGGLEVDISQP
jgi:hypothetical protein